MNFSPLQKERYKFKPKLPAILEADAAEVVAELGEPTASIADQDEIKQIFPLTYAAPVARFVKGANPAAGEAINVGIILSGGQAPGGHNVIAGLFDSLKKANPGSKLLGFLAGPDGILKNQFIELTADRVNEYRNTGGFNIIGSGRTKIETADQFAQTLKNARANNLRALVIVGGDDSNTNAALLAEYFAAQKSDILVIGAPKTIDGDLKNQYIETSFGFDTACKVYAELVGNLMQDAASAQKYWHFIRLMGRAASHIALECALATQPNFCAISEEVAEKKLSLSQIVDELARIIAGRAEKGENFGVALVPEGLIEFVPEMKALIEELSLLLVREAAVFDRISVFQEQVDFCQNKLSAGAAAVFRQLPETIRQQLLLDRDPHGNLQVSRIETEKLLIEMVDAKLKEMKKAGRYNGKFAALSHFFGYEGRSAFPSNFDAGYCYALGASAFFLIANRLTGYMACVRNLAESADQWQAGGVPQTTMINLETRHGQSKPVIRKALVDLKGAAFSCFSDRRGDWALETSYRNPGAIQYFGPVSVCDRPSETLLLEQGKA